ncbi:hypothetical protein [Microbacterium sp. 22296]|uniref:hypothetical protein n=1 Tax=Microbacterium sp. 22296 TaxID=3453903 RepID=UPI003F867218
MTIIHQDAPARHVIRVDDEITHRPIFYCENIDGSSLLRVHYRLGWVTGRPGEFELRHFAGATETERARALDRTSSYSNVDDLFRDWRAAGVTHRVRWRKDRRRWVEYVYLGSVVDDPMVQLELEMMIDRQGGSDRSVRSVLERIAA